MPPLPNYHFNANFSGSNFSSCTLFPKLIILSSQDLFTCLNFSVLPYHLYSFCCIINHSLMQWFKATISDFAVYPIKEPAKELASLDWAWWGALLHSLSEEELDLYNGKSLIMLHGFTTEPPTRQPQLQWSRQKKHARLSHLLNLSKESHMDES